ncbi:alcohol dehydrogenase [Cladophialophora yegresii CBS 114405]|uniref:Alcohol dehydrogenase n=1 Tax=Cladophialophora yegresii CBS 114405 TaxID=1182544 RepID=W9W2H1_9EURO|nr:alcohol dehydrogenase [Cladophialophora yegresii CBS 114405]EXJ59200.1 alcohol dehydrogenase [Cladophialophora yegresii CBS 114405]
MGFLYSQLFVTPAYPTRSFAGETVIVTGSNTGLGKEAARHIARLGTSKLILAVRNTKAGEDAKKNIESTTGCDPSVIEVWSLDLSSYDSVKAFADRASKLQRIDVLLENAGIAAAKYSQAEGHERTITVNVISTFLLALLLLPKLKATARQFNTSPRLTIVSSEVHGWTKFPEGKQPTDQIFPTLDGEKTANMGERYPTSKLLEVLVVKQLAPKLASSGVTLNILNPGLCHSELSRDGPLFLEVLKFFLARRTEVGSRTLVASAAAGPESHGKYMHDGKVDESALSPFVRSKDGEAASQKVWQALSDILEKISPGLTANL